VEFEMTDNQVSLATQMTTQERKLSLFWAQHQKIKHYTALIKEAAAGGMRVDTFQEMVACESVNIFKGCFANEELWLDDPKWDEMRANVVAQLNSSEKQAHCGTQTRGRATDGKVDPTAHKVA